MARGQPGRLEGEPKPREGSTLARVTQQLGARPRPERSPEAEGAVALGKESLVPALLRSELG